MTKAGEFDLDTLARTVLDAHPKLEALGRRLSLELYRTLVEGAPVPRGVLARRLDVPQETVDRILDSWPGVFSDSKRRVVGYWGLSLPSAYGGPHRFTIDDRCFSAWCAWDTLFLPELLGRTARVESTSPHSRAPVRVTISPERVERVEPCEASMSFLVPDAAGVRNDVVANFCHFIHFFPSREAGESWTARRPGTFVLSIDDAYALGRRKNAAQYGGALQ